MPSLLLTEPLSCPNGLQVGKNVLFETVGQNEFRAANVHSGQQLVCKVFPISRYLRSVAIYHHLPVHPNLSQLTETVVGETMAYVFFDLASYGNMHTYVQTSRSLDEDEASRLFHQMVSVVAHCHNNDVVLRDLKLRKFLFKNPERTMLTLSNLEDAHMMEKGDDSVYGKHGCPVYASPEGLRAEGKYSGKAADVWSLGVALYIILVGRYPFSDSNSNMLFNKIQRCKFSLPDTLSPKARCLIQNILRLDPTERLTAEDILDHPWFSSLSSQKVWRSMFYQDDDQMVPEFCS
ncbi:tribbles homolog 2-like [Pygocentrus nattereri]|nr:tribbles homolog 2-like [Pygocentrus nattereri]